jgi:starch phosphorylase
MVPRTFIFGGKAAPGYAMAKLIIKLITSVASLVNNDPDVQGRLKVVYIPNFNVKVGQHIYPAADLSEQISTAGKEASGTGNMKFSLNGALTIGTLDGANVEIREAVGSENFFLFGLDVDKVQSLYNGGYNPFSVYEGDRELQKVLAYLRNGNLSVNDKELFIPLFDHLVFQDEYFVLADYRSYINCQADVERTWRNVDDWTAKSVINTARMGYFSSDRSIEEYGNFIWNVKPVAIDIENM